VRIHEVAGAELCAELTRVGRPRGGVPPEQKGHTSTEWLSGGVVRGVLDQSEAKTRGVPTMMLLARPGRV